MKTAEKRDTPSANGEPVDLKQCEQERPSRADRHRSRYAQSIIDARPFGSKEDLLKKKLIPQDPSGDLRQDSDPRNGPWLQETISA